MGYYSQVAIGMRNANAKAMMEEFIQKFPDSGLFDKCRFGCICHKGKEHTVFYWDSVKWYEDTIPGFEDIQWVMEYLRERLDRETEPFYFVRIGESMGDVEDDCNIAEAEENEIQGACFESVANIGFYGEFRALVEDTQEGEEDVKENKNEFICPVCGSTFLSGVDGYMEKDNGIMILHHCLSCNAAVGKIYAKVPGTVPGSFELYHVKNRGMIEEKEE